MKFWHILLALILNDLFCAGVIIGIGWYLFNIPLDQLLKALLPAYTAYWTPWAIGGFIAWLVIVMELYAIWKKK